MREQAHLSQKDVYNPLLFLCQLVQAQSHKSPGAFVGGVLVTFSWEDTLADQGHAGVSTFHKAVSQEQAARDDVVWAYFLSQFSMILTTQTHVLQQFIWQWVT